MQSFFHKHSWYLVLGHGWVIIYHILWYSHNVLFDHHPICVITTCDMSHSYGPVLLYFFVVVLFLPLYFQFLMDPCDPFINILWGCFTDSRAIV